MKRMHREPSRPTEGEPEPLRIRWEKAAATVRDLHEEVSRTRPHGSLEPVNEREFEELQILLDRKRQRP
jgi:hypothetical protein